MTDWEYLFNLGTGEQVHATIDGQLKRWVKVRRPEDDYRQLWVDVDTGDESSSYTLEVALIPATDIQIHRLESLR